MADVEYCRNLDCWIKSYKLHGFDVYKFYGKGVTTCWEIWYPHGGPRAYQCDWYQHVLDWTREHQKEIV